MSVALWRAHVERALRAAKTLQGRRADAAAGARAIRWRCARWCWCCVVATFFAAGGDRMKRVAAAFDWQGVIAPANFRIDAWVSPPTYTGKPPLILQGLRPGEPVQTATRRSRCRPAARWSSAPPARSISTSSTSGGLAEPAVRRASRRPPGHRGAPLRHQRRRRGDRARRGSSDVTWQFTAIPGPAADHRARQGSRRRRRAARLQLTYKLEDDYGVVGAQATFKLLGAAPAPTASRRARSTRRPISRCRCRRRAPAAASGRPPRI